MTANACQLGAPFQKQISTNECSSREMSVAKCGPQYHLTHPALITVTPAATKKHRSMRGLCSPFMYVCMHAARYALLFFILLRLPNQTTSKREPFNHRRGRTHHPGKHLWLRSPIRVTSGSIGLGGCCSCWCSTKTFYQTVCQQSPGPHIHIGYRVNIRAAG